MAESKLVNDAELIQLAQMGDNHAMNELLLRHKDIAEKQARKYYRTGYTYEDLFQEGMIGIFQAVNKFSHERSSSFSLFAAMLVSRRIKDTVRNGVCLKHKFHNSALSLDAKVYGDEPITICDITIDENSIDPLDMVLEKEFMDQLTEFINKKLTVFERTVLYYRLHELSYRAIATHLGIKVKAIDNARSRIKVKFNKRTVH